MTKKVKLAFEQLEQELTILPREELLHYLGGTSSGSSSGLAWDASLDDVVDYLLDMGFPMSEDSSGNYTFTPPGSSGSIMLDEVVVYAYSSGSGSSGSSGYGGIMDMYVGYFESYGYTFSGGGSGGLPIRVREAVAVARGAGMIRGHGIRPGLF